MLVSLKKTILLLTFLSVKVLQLYSSCKNQNKQETVNQLFDCKTFSGSPNELRLFWAKALTILDAHLT